MRLLALAATAVVLRLIWKRQLDFEQGLCGVVADMQTETLGLVEERFASGDIFAGSMN